MVQESASLPVLQLLMSMLVFVCVAEVSTREMACDGQFGCIALKVMLRGGMDSMEAVLNAIVYSQSLPNADAREFPQLLGGASSTLGRRNRPEHPRWQYVTVGELMASPATSIQVRLYLKSESKLQLGKLAKLQVFF